MSNISWTKGIQVCLGVREIWPFHPGRSNRLWHRVLASSMDFTCNVLRLQWSRLQGKKIHFLSLAGLLDNASPYLPLSWLQLITSILVGDNMGIGFLVSRVAPSGENEERKWKAMHKVEERRAFSYCRESHDEVQCRTHMDILKWTTLRLVH